jgi:hypothetical protein
MSHHPHTSSEFTRSFLPIAAVLVRVASAATCAAEPISPWPSLVLEERLPRVDAIAIARWGEPSGVAVYDESGNRAVYLRRRLHVTRVLFGKLPRNPDLLVRGGSYFDRNLNSYVVDDVEVVTLLPATTDFIVLLKHLAGSQYELLDGSRGKLRAWDERTATPNTLVMTRRRDLLPAGAVLPMKTPAPDIAAASLSIDQFQELVVRLSQEPSSAHDAERDTGLRFVKNAKFIDRRTIVERLGEAADRFVASRTSGAFLRDHLVREPNSQWIPQPQVSDQRVQIRQPGAVSGSPTGCERSGRPSSPPRSLSEWVSTRRFWWAETKPPIAATIQKRARSMSTLVKLRRSLASTDLTAESRAGTRIRIGTQAAVRSSGSSSSLRKMTAHTSCL